MTHPILYEINTRAWLLELSEKLGRSVTLAGIPESEMVQWRDLGLTYIWLMGVWSSGPLARHKALAEPVQRRIYSEVLPDWREEDVAGSPYAIADYRVPERLGGEAGLGRFREQLHRFGMKLLLDFVPNHLGLDHAWITEQSELFVQSAIQVPETFPLAASTGSRWLAHGKDPNFGAWTDTAQLDYRLEATRASMLILLQSVAQRCDGVRCDMAMLVLNDVFEKTWASFPLPHDALRITPQPEFWSSAISTIRQTHPGFLFLAESYWGLESRLQALGFDYTYDKELIIAVAHDAAGVQRHLLGETPEFLAASAHFLENHDERRIASIFSLPEHRAAAMIILGLPGMRFLHEGQLAGARLKSPVQLLRRSNEPVLGEVEALYRQLLTTFRKTAIGRGSSKLLKPRNAWPENPTAENFVLIQWQAESSEFELIVVNYAPHPGQCYAPLSIGGLESSDWVVKDRLSEESYRFSGSDLQTNGFYLDLPAHGARLFHFQPGP